MPPGGLPAYLCGACLAMYESRSARGVAAFGLGLLSLAMRTYPTFLRPLSLAALVWRALRRLLCRRCSCPRCCWQWRRLGAAMQRLGCGRRLLVRRSISGKRRPGNRRDLDAPVAGAAGFIGVRADGLLGAEGSGEYFRSGNACFDERARDGKRALGRELPIVGKAPVVAMNGLVVGKAADHQRLVVGTQVL